MHVYLTYKFISFLMAFSIFRLVENFSFNSQKTVEHKKHGPSKKPTTFLCLNLETCNFVCELSTCNPKKVAQQIFDQSIFCLGNWHFLKGNWHFLKGNPKFPTMSTASLSQYFFYKVTRTAHLFARDTMPIKWRPLSIRGFKNSKNAKNCA